MTQPDPAARMHPTTIRISQAHSPYRVRLAGAVAFSLLVHALIVSLQFGIPGIGLPTLESPWRERRAQPADLNVVLVNPGQAKAEAEGKPAESSGADATRVAPPPSGATLKLYSSPDALRPAPPAPATATKARARKSTAQPIARRQPARAKKQTPVIALNEARKDAFVVPAPALDEATPETAIEYEKPTPTVASAEPVVTDIAPQPAGEDPAAVENEQAAAKRAEEAQARLARETEARQQREAAVQRDAQAQEQRLAREREASQLAEDNARHQAALALQKQVQEQQQRQLLREQEDAAQRALELAAKQREEKRLREVEQAEREAFELQARKQMEETVRQQAMARERERQAEDLAAKDEQRTQALAARQKATSEAAAARQRDVELMLGNAPPSGNPRGADRPSETSPLPRDIVGGGLTGRALDQIRRPDLPQKTVPLARPQDGIDNPRRRTSIFGNADKDVGLMMYVESWRLKIERNGSLNYKPSSAEKAHSDPVVTVAIRSDGSVEDIAIHRSSGRPELDEAVRRIVRINARYSVFPPELARRFDVIEIRRAWNFDDRLRIMEEVR